MSALATPRTDVRLEGIEVAAYEIPTDAPEADGTIEWSSTTMIVVHARAGGEAGIGWTYGAAAVSNLIAGKLAGLLEGADALSPAAAWQAMRAQLRNAGWPGVGAMAASAIDTAFWDLKAKLLGLPLCTLLGSVRDEVPVYGSGGFTSYSERRLREQLGGWAAEGIPRVKMKVGTHPERDSLRVRAARQEVGPDVEVFVDGNGAYGRKQALEMAQRFREQAQVSWFEEPVSSEDLDGLRLIRDRGPAGMPIAAGEYGWDAQYFRRMLEAGAVDVLQADGTRCGGVTGFLQASALCTAAGLPLSAHCAPALHLHACLAAPPLVHVEWFHDHVRIEQMLLDGAPSATGGAMRPDLSRPGLGVELKAADAEEYRK